MVQHVTDTIFTFEVPSRLKRTNADNYSHSDIVFDFKTTLLRVLQEDNYAMQPFSR